MLNRVDLYYFSPTGGTKKTGEILAGEMAGKIEPVNLGDKKELRAPDGEAAVFAVPVFGGRIPAVTAEKLQKLEGGGKKAVTIVVYGTRAYEDALLELNDIILGCGFQVIASGAFVAQHSMVPKVGAGRPDEKDAAEIKEFAAKVLEKLEKGETKAVQVPGNHPYKEWPGMPAAPVSLPECKLCGKCASICPTGAITMGEQEVLADASVCTLCMACVAACPEHARILPHPLKETLNQKLGALKDVRRENETFL